MLVDVFLRLVVVVGVMLPVALVAVGGGRRVLARRRSWWRSRLREHAPYLAVLAVVLALNRLMRRADPQVTERFGVHMTEAFYWFEGEFVVHFQAVATSEVTAYFSFVYVYGYSFLLIFPAVAYVALSEAGPFKRLVTAYSLNYVLGLALYLLVIAHGPRNVMPEMFQTVLYEVNPEYQHLTREVNRNTNVFPSLHTSLAATVAIFAYRTRAAYPRWIPVAAVLAASVVVSTMYLGIHWAIDVVAGLGLAIVCVRLADAIVERTSASEPADE